MNPRHYEPTHARTLHSPRTLWAQMSVVSQGHVPGLCIVFSAPIGLTGWGIHTDFEKPMWEDLWRSMELGGASGRGV